MAPPNARRTGFSKRAQYTTFIGYLAAIAGALVGAAVLVVSILNPAAFAGMRGAASDVAAPAGTAVSAGRSSLHTFGAAIWGFATWGPRNAAMERELEVARVRLAEARAMADENRRLKGLLALRDDAVQPVAFARLIASTGSSLRRFATISAGRDQGVMIGMPVRSALGVVGRVLEVSATTSRVLLITDPESLVPVQRARDGLPAFAQGHGDGTLQIRLISLGLNPLKPGDVFVTSGSGGLYRPGTAIAVTVALTRDGAIARVLSDPSTTTFVAVYPIYAESAGMADALVSVGAAAAAVPTAKPPSKTVTSAAPAGAQ